jgi:hypothetical protein
LGLGLGSGAGVGVRVGVRVGVGARVGVGVWVDHLRYGRGEAARRGAIGLRPNKGQVRDRDRDRVHSAPP